jgi:hypothetical protein
VARRGTQGVLPIHGEEEADVVPIHLLHLCITLMQDYGLPAAPQQGTVKNG